MNVSIRSLPRQRVAFRRHVGAYDCCGASWEVFLSEIGALGLLGPGVRLLGLCHDDPKVTAAERVRYDCCVPVGEDFEPSGEIGVQFVAGGDYAVATHQGPYDRLGETYDGLIGQWVPRSGRQLRAVPCFEIYLNDPEGSDPEELLTDVYVPLEAVARGFL